ncbi:BrnT family toxin [soil metagenome]
MARFGYEWDEVKRAANLEKHDIDFLALARFDWDGAWTKPDTRPAYDEARYIAYAMLDGRLHAVVFTPRGAIRRIISLRKANRREQAAFQARLRG